MKNGILKKIFACVFVICFVSGVAMAAENSNVSIPSGENIPTDLIRAGETVDVGGDVNGDVILAGANISFSGNAAGDILLAGGNARAYGSASGDVRIVGGNVTLSGVVDRNVTVAGGSVIIEEGSVVRGNLYVAGGNVELRGLVEGNAAAYASQILFSGRVNGDADLRAGQIIVRRDAVIEGNLTYASDSELALEEGVVRGEVSRLPREDFAAGYARDEGGEGAIDAGFIVWQFLSLLALALILSRFFGKQMRALSSPATREEIWNRLAWGIISLILNPIVIFITFITIIGVPIALMILFIYVIFIIIAMVIAPMLLGKWANSRLKLYPWEEYSLIKDFILGYVVMQVISLIPFLGSLFVFFLFLFAFGRVTRYIFLAIKENK